MFQAINKHTIENIFIHGVSCNYIKYRGFMLSGQTL